MPQAPGSTRPTSRRATRRRPGREQEKSTSKRLPNYQRIRIESVEYNGWDAADWEFTFGNNTHVLNRGFVPDKNHGYAIYLSSREENWSANQQVFDTAADTFQPGMQGWVSDGQGRLTAAATTARRPATEA